MRFSVIAGSSEFSDCFRPAPIVFGFSHIFNVLVGQIDRPRGGDWEAAHPEDNYLRNMRRLTWCINLIAEFQERSISTAATTKREDRNASARAFIHSLNILVK